LLLLTLKAKTSLAFIRLLATFPAIEGQSTDNRVQITADVSSTGCEYKHLLMR